MSGATVLQPLENQERLTLVSPPKSLLVIEDDLSQVEFIDLVLDEAKPNVDWEYATTGEKALDMIRRRAHRLHTDQPYSLVITDIFLEGDTTGFDVWLECQQLFPKMPFVFTSSLSFDRYFSILKGVSNCPMYMTKPLTVSRCLSVFEEYL